MVYKVRSSMMACDAVIFMTALGVLAMEQPAVTDPFKQLNLSGYSSSMRTPDFSGLTGDGKPMLLAGLGARVVLLNFWATWCRQLAGGSANQQRIQSIR